MLTLINKEIRSFLGSLIGYIVIVVFLSTIGLMMWVFPGGTNVLDNGYANIDALFYVAPCFLAKYSLHRLSHFHRL